MALYGYTSLLSLELPAGVEMYEGTYECEVEESSNLAFGSLRQPAPAAATVHWPPPEASTPCRRERRYGLPLPQRVSFGVRIQLMVIFPTR